MRTSWCVYGHRSRLSICLCADAARAVSASSGPPSPTRGDAAAGRAPADLVLADTALTRPDSVGFVRRVLAARPGRRCVLLGTEESGVARRPPIAAGAARAHPGRRRDDLDQRGGQGAAAARRARPVPRRHRVARTPRRDAAAAGRGRPGRAGPPARDPGRARLAGDGGRRMPAGRHAGRCRCSGATDAADAGGGRRRRQAAPAGRGPAAPRRRRRSAIGADRAGAAGAARHGGRQEQRRDRAGAVRLRGHGQDARSAAVPQAGRPRPGARRGGRLPRRAGRASRVQAIAGQPVGPGAALASRSSSSSSHRSVSCTPSA